jgi:hypothetical protein
MYTKRLCCVFLLMSWADGFNPAVQHCLQYSFVSDNALSGKFQSGKFQSMFKSLQHPAVRFRMKSGVKNVRAGVSKENDSENSDMIKYLRESLSQMATKKLNVGQLRPELHKKMAKCAKELAKMPSPIQCSALSHGRLLVGRWKLAITSSLSWFQELWPSQEVFLEIQDGGITGRMQYVMNFASPRLLLRSLRCDARFLISGPVLNIACRRIFANVAGRELPLFFLPAHIFGGSMLTSYFDGDLWVVDGGGAVYQYVGDTSAEVENQARLLTRYDHVHSVESTS